MITLGSKGTASASACAALQGCSQTNLKWSGPCCFSQCSTKSIVSFSFIFSILPSSAYKLTKLTKMLLLTSSSQAAGRLSWMEPLASARRSLPQPTTRQVTYAVDQVETQIRRAWKLKKFAMATWKSIQHVQL